MKNFINENRIFLLLYLFFLVIGGALIAIYEQGDEIIYLNSLHTPFFNQFFKWATLLGEFPVMISILLVAIFVSYGKGLLLTLNAGCIFTTVQICKRLVFAELVRPSVYFEGKTTLDFVQGVEIERFHSFPSGHTAAAFAFFFMLSIFSKNKNWSYLFFALALVVAVSRVYLLQHFLRDVYFGSLLAMLVTTLFYLTFIQSKYYNNLTWKDKRLYK